MSTGRPKQPGGPAIPDLDLGDDPALQAAQPRPQPARGSSPFANPRAAVPVSGRAGQERPHVVPRVPPPEQIPLDDAGAQKAAPEGPALVETAAPPAFDGELELGEPAPGRASPSQRSGATAPTATPSETTAQVGQGANPSDYFGSGQFDEGFFDGKSVEATGGPQATSPLDYFGAGTFDDDDFDSFSRGSSMELGDGGQPGPAAAAPIETGPPWPTGQTPQPETLAIDDVEIGLVADYGPAPAGFWAAPQYAFRVARRHKELKRRSAEATAALDATIAVRDDLLMEMVQSLRPTLEHDDSFKRLLEPALARERVAQERSDALAGTNQEYNEKLQQIEALKARGDSEIAEKRARQAELQKVVEEREEPHKKASVHLKRVFIELRSLSNVAQNAAKTGQPLPADHTQKVAHFEARKREIQAQVDALAAEVEKARAPLVEVQKQMKEHERSLREIDAQRRALDAEYQRQVGARNVGVESAERQLRDAFAEAGRGVLSARGTLPVEPERLAAIRDADQAVHRAATEAEKHRRALDSRNAEAVKRGWLVAGAAAGAVVLLIILLAAI